MKYLIFAILGFGSVAAQAQIIEPQVLPRYGDTYSQVHWFDVPTDIQARLIWSHYPAIQPTFWWGDLRGGRTEIHPVEIGERPFFGSTYSPQTKVTTDSVALRKVGFYNWKFSPDATKVLGQIAPFEGSSANYHNTRIFDFATQRFFKVADGLYENNEVWSPDGQKIAFLRSTGDYTAGRNLPTVGLWLFDVKSAKETVLRREQSMHSLRWTPYRDLLADTYLPNPNNSNSLYFRLRFPQGQKPPRVEEPYLPPTISPDGTKQAYFAPLHSTSEKGAANPRMLWIADRNGRNARALCPQGEVGGLLEWAPSQNVLWIWKPDVTTAQSPTESKEHLSLKLFRIDVKTGSHELWADLHAENNADEKFFSLFGDPLGWAAEQPYSNLNLVEPLGLSRDGAYYFLHRSERIEKDGLIYIQANTLHALRLSDGKLFPIAVFKSHFAIAPL